jgi:hypothetical protein
LVTKGRGLVDIKAVEEKRKDKIPYIHNKSIFKNYDPIKISKNTGCAYNETRSEFTVRLMGKDYIVKYPEGDIFKEDYTEIEKYPIKTLILRYLINAKGVPPSNKNITYRDVPGGDVYYRNFLGRCITRLHKTFGNNINGFKFALESIGAERVDLGDIAYRFEFINNVFLTFVLWEGDEELTPSAQILFDANAPFYFNAEDLAFVGDVSIGKITKLAYNKVS